MKRFFVRASVVATLAFAFAIGCGGAPQKSAAEPPSAPAQAGGAYAQPGGYPAQAAPEAPAAESQKKSERANADATTPTTAPAPAPAPAPPRAAGTGSSSSGALAARRDIEAAQRELESAGSDCAAACRALGSMERATARLCVLEEASCEDVRVRLVRSRQRVRATCGSCPGGPSVDPDAPIPSR